MNKVFEPVSEGEVFEVTRKLNEIMQKFIKNCRSEYELVNKLGHFRAVLKAIDEEVERAYLDRYDRIKETQE